MTEFDSAGATGAATTADFGDDLAALTPDSGGVRASDGRIRRWNPGPERLYD